MKAVLAIVGCGTRLEVALAREPAATPGIVGLAGPTPRSELIMAAIDLLLRSADVTRGDLTAILATCGPGSFTGIRVALATAQGLSRAIGCPACGVPSLTMIAARASTARRIAVQAARRGFVYLQTFEDRDGCPHPLDSPRVEPLSALAVLEDPVVAAEGVDLPPGLRRVPAERSAAEALLGLVNRWPAGAETLVPIYLEPPHVTPPGRKTV